MSLTSRVVNAKPTKVKISVKCHFCQSPILRTMSLTFVRICKNGTHAVRISDQRYPDTINEASEVYYRSSTVTTSVVKTRDIYRYRLVYV